MNIFSVESDGLGWSRSVGGGWGWFLALNPNPAWGPTGILSFSPTPQIYTVKP